MTRATLLLLALLTPWFGCGGAPRPCVEDAECFAGEYCARGTCANYTGKTITKPRPQQDMTLELPKLDGGNPFVPRDMPSDLDAGDLEDVKAPPG